MFQRAAEGKRGEEALHAMGTPTSTSSWTSDRVRLRAQMQAYAACDDPEICEVVRNGFGDLVAYVAAGLRPAVGEHLALLRHGDDAQRPRVDAGARRLRAVGADLLDGCGKDI